MAWLLSLLRPVWTWLLSTLLQKVTDAIAGAYLAYQAKKEREAKTKKQEEELRKHLKEAGYDEKAQEDAYDKYFDNRK